MEKIKSAGEVMADDMHEAAMRLGTAEMMLASACDASRASRKLTRKFPYKYS